MNTILRRAGIGTGILAATALVTNLAFGATVNNLFPISDGVYTQWTPKLGTIIHYTQIDETICNGIVDYVRATAVGSRDSYGVSLSSIPNGSTITAIEVRPCASKNKSNGPNSTMKVFYRANGVNSADAGAYLLSGTIPTVQATTTWSGLSIVKNASTTLEVGAVLFAGAKGARLSQMKVGLTYTPPVQAQPVLTISLSPASPPAKQVVMGSTDNSLLVFRLSATTTEDIRLTDIVIPESISLNGTSTAPSLQNVTLWDGSTMIGGPVELGSGTSTAAAVFHLSNGGLVIPKNSTKELTLKGDVSSFSSGGAKSGSVHTFFVTNNPLQVNAIGMTSNTPVTLLGGANGNPITVYRTKVTLSSTVLGAATARARTVVDDLASLSFSANPAYQADLRQVALTFSGGVFVTSTTPFAVDLIDANTNASFGSAVTQTCTPAGGSCRVTFLPQFIIDAGAAKAAKVRIDSTGFWNSPLSPDTFTVLVNHTSSVLISDGSVQHIPLEATVVPFGVASVTYE